MTSRFGFGARSAALLLAAALLLQGCTAFKSDATYRLVCERARLFERTENAVQPKADWLQVMLFPVVLPLSYVAWIGDIALFLVDDLVINPPRFFWRGFETGWNFLWGPDADAAEAAEEAVDPAASPYRRAMTSTGRLVLKSTKFTFKVLMTPPTIVMACLGHALIWGKGEIGDE